MLVIVRSLISRFLIQSQLCRRDWNIFRPLSQNISRLARLISLLTRRAFSRATGDGPPRPPRFVVRYTLPYGLLLGQLHGGTFVFFVPVGFFSAVPLSGLVLRPLLFRGRCLRVGCPGGSPVVRCVLSLGSRSSEVSFLAELLAPPSNIFAGLVVVGSFF